MGENDSPATPIPIIRVKRERWSDGKYHSVARNEKGHMLSWRSWKGKQSTESTKDRAIFNYHKKRTPPTQFTVAEITTVPVRTDLVLKQPQEAIHKRYSIVCKIATTYGSFWFISIESNNKYLSEVDKSYIRRKLAREYQPKKHDLIYSESIKEVIPVVCTDLDTRKKVIF